MDRPRGTQQLSHAKSPVVILVYPGFAWIEYVSDECPEVHGAFGHGAFPFTDFDGRH